MRCPHSHTAGLGAGKGLGGCPGANVWTAIVRCPDSHTTKLGVRKDLGGCLGANMWTVRYPHGHTCASPSLTNSQKAATCAWLFAPIKGGVTPQANILCPGVHNLPEQRKNGSGGSPPDPCKTRKSGGSCFFGTKKAAKRPLFLLFLFQRNIQDLQKGFRHFL